MKMVKKNSSFKKHPLAAYFSNFKPVVSNMLVLSVNEYGWGY